MMGPKLTAPPDEPNVEAVFKEWRKNQDPFLLKGMHRNQLPPCLQLMDTAPRHLVKTVLFHLMDSVQLHLTDTCLQYCCTSETWYC